MCQLCDANDGNLQSCQDCGRLICFDEKPDSVDVIDRAYVTESGDVFCRRCGRKYDAASEREREEEFYEPPYDQYEDGPAEL